MSKEGLREARGVAPTPKAIGGRGLISRNALAVVLTGFSFVAGGAYVLGKNSAESNGGEQSASEAQQALCTDIEGVTGAEADYSGYRVSSGKNINLGPASPGSDKLAIEDYLPTPNIVVDDTKAVSPYVAMMKELLNKKEIDDIGGFTDDQTKDVIAAANARKRSYAPSGEVDVKAVQADCKYVADESKARFDISSKALQKGVKYVEYIYKENENGDVSYDTRVFAATEDVEGMIDTKKGSSLRVMVPYVSSLNIIRTKVHRKKSKISTIKL
jgi:hypothetical protein